MKITLDRDKEIEANRIKIQVDEDTHLNITNDPIRGITIQKSHYGDGSSELMITPHVSNEISLK